MNRREFCRLIAMAGAAAAASLKFSADERQREKKQSEKLDRATFQRNECSFIQGRCSHSVVAAIGAGGYICIKCNMVWPGLGAVEF